jgi:hypothetical protein
MNETTRAASRSKPALTTRCQAEPGNPAAWIEAWALIAEPACRRGAAAHAARPVRCAAKILIQVLQETWRAPAPPRSPRFSARDGRRRCLQDEPHAGAQQTVTFHPDGRRLMISGAIAAANAVSDVYGWARRSLAPRSLCFPPRPAIPGVLAIVRGGAGCPPQGGGPVLGGHSVRDPRSSSATRDRRGASEAWSRTRGEARRFRC